ncbi:LysE/ArgO family amino acid transporter [Amycolatopsis taiwanensis]|uniref:Amino acid transporter n=1 Tax=Amycolatopsis taiwanensis TaxID=342230 RepID=A0A9W6R0Z7_9PSEU|nr:LysE family transporter [Amycolatopsis taiwanensis]GLY65560.1 amino acid transporter [Amycolatopsis taiwanensis]
MTAVLLTVAAGFGTGLSLIVAIGAQNAFVLRQGIRREAVPLVVAICTASDALLIALGVAGVGSLVQAEPTALRVVGVGGGVFLICYGVLAARRIARPAALTTTGTTIGSARRAALTCLTLTWLNPHVYLDTVLLVGSIAATHGPLRWNFAFGATLASVCWFAALGFGARLLTGFFTRPSSWRILDSLVAITMLTVGVTLLAGA